MRNTSSLHRFVCVGIAGLLAASQPLYTAAMAFAETSAELEAQANAVAAERQGLEAEVAAAMQQLESLYDEAEAAENDLVTTQYRLDETQNKITELDGQIQLTQAQLETTQDDLAAIVANNYKNGAPTLINIILEATSFDDLISRITYANKVTEHENNVIAEVRTLKGQIADQKLQEEAEKAQLEQYKAEQEERLRAAEEAAAAVETYRAQLSDEISAKIAEEEQTRQRAAEEAAREAAEEARRKAEEEAARRAAEEAARAAAAAQAAEARSNSSSSDDSSSDSSGSSSSSSGGWSGTVPPSGSVENLVARAYSIIGSGYSWSGYYWSGSTSSSWFTCSGVADFALGLPSRSNSPETLYAQVGSRMKYSVSELNYGDLVFFYYAGRSPGHVGVYIGGGDMIDACPGIGVTIRSADRASFIGGGPIY